MTTPRARAEAEPLTPSGALERVQRLARGALAEGAESADRDARFPAPAVAAMRDAGLLAAALPTALGGIGLSTAMLVACATELARGCGSTAMVWAMHQIQLAAVAKHGGDTDWFLDFLSDCARRQLLIASVTSEIGSGGDLRNSQAAVRHHAGLVTFAKRAPTISYADQADAYLVTLRRDAEAPPTDQVAVLALRDQVVLTERGRWNPMGMRGTDSPGYLIQAEVAPGQILADPFDVVASSTMVPLSHLLWSAVWLGLATEALDRATRYTRERNHAGPARDHRLVAAAGLRSGIEARLASAVDAYDQLSAGKHPSTPGLAVRFNELKLAASVEAVRVAQIALEVCGMAGYREDGPYSIARLLRDLHSAPLMISNERIAATNAALLLVARYGQRAEGAT